MAHGTPDFGVTAGAATTHQLFDVGELAARLGSPDTYDRRGDVMFWEDFECGLARWLIQFSGGAGTGALTTTRARNGRNSLSLTTAAVAGALARAIAFLPPPAGSRIGLEASAEFTDVNNRLEWRIILQDDGIEYDYFVRWDNDLQQLLTFGPGSVYTAFASDVRLSNTARLFNTGKIVIDEEGQQYERFILNGEEYDIRGRVPFSGASGIPDRMQAEIVAGAINAAAKTVNWDDVIVTQNEPANP